MSAQTDDKVWFNSQRRLAGICADVAAFRSQQHSVLLLCHFPTTLSTLQQSLHDASLSFEAFSLADSSMLCSMGTGKFLVGLVRAFQPTTTLIGSGQSSPSLQIIVAEHHPIYGKDRAVVETAERLSCKPFICFHGALDDPLMKHFGSDKIIDLFRRLGIDEAESISHPFVTSAIQNAQEKIEKQVQKDVATESMEDWFRFNMRQTR